MTLKPAPSALAAVADPARMGMALAAIANNCDLFIFDKAKVTIGVVINFHDIRFPSIICHPEFVSK
jgi:hypothetical protein